MINENIVKGKWAEFKGEIQKMWGEITGDELEQTKGDTSQIGGLVQRKYGKFEEDARHALNSIIDRYSDKATTTNSAKSTDDLATKM